MNKSPVKFGCWPSKVSAEFVAGKTLRFQTVQALDDTLFWSEQRPQENGRAAIMSARLGELPKEILHAPYSARSRVHEYGGNAFLATSSELFFVNGDDQDIWSLKFTWDTKDPPQPQRITNAPQWRFADLVLDEPRNRLICVAEYQTKNHTLPQNLLISVSLDKNTRKQITPLVEGDDFYASPRLSSDSRQLAFISWNLPSMPWERAKLSLADLDDKGTLTTIHHPDNALDGASFQPEWDRNDQLWFINDATGFGQLYRFDGDQVTLFAQADTELGAPLWVFGMKTYGFLNDGRIAALSLAKGKALICLMDPAEQGRFTTPGADLEADTPHRSGKTEICALDQLVTIDNSIAGILSQIDQAEAIASICAQTGIITTLKTGSSFDLPTDDISIASAQEFENDLGQIVYGNYYAPTNQTCRGPEGELPPVILTAHGGPTAYSNNGLKPKIQYWTSRGFGYFDVNYSGSWGFGKAYRQRLDGHWGVRDVADMEAAARHLTKAGLADPARLLISGSSAGGYTVLMSLVKSDLFAAGASYYGISDLARLIDSTHKFEAGYLDSLLGLTPENRAAILKKRSPLFSAEQISSPVIFFQGMQDKVVPPDQAELMVNALEKRHIKVRHKTFENEGHGFRSSQTIKTALNMEYDFYTDVLGLEHCRNESR